MRRIAPLASLFLLLLAPASAGAATSDLMMPTLAAGPCVLTSAEATVPAVVREHDPASVPLDGNLTASPAGFDFADAPVEAGGSYLCLLKLRNRRATTTTFDLVPRGARGSHAAGSSVEFLDPDDPRARASAGSWLDPRPRSITLAPREVATIPIVLTVPADPPRGAAYGGIDIVTRTKASAGGADTALGIESRIDVAFLVRVGGTGRARLHLHGVQAPRLRWNRDPWTLRGTLDNDGTLHAVPTGRVRVRSLFGNTVAELPISGRPLLPGGRTRLAMTWTGVPWLGIYRYDLRIAAARDDGAGVAHARGWFVALPPVWVLVLVAIVLLVLAAGSIARRRADRRWAEQELRGDDLPDDEDDQSLA